MALVERVRPTIGDVIEISTPRGLAYAHYTHRHATYGALLRVMSDLHSTRPAEFSTWVNAKPRFMTFFPLAAACSRRLVKIVANEDVPVAARTFPTFRARNGPADAWWLWDGEKEWRVGALQPGMETFPIRGVWNDTLLIERIVEGWSHESVV